MRRELIILGIVVVLLGLGVAIYFLFFQSKATLITTPGTTTTPGLPSAGNTTPPSSETPGTLPSEPPGTPVEVSSRLVKISSGPVVPGEEVINVKKSVAGATATSTQTITDVSVNYIERQSGNVFSYLVKGKTLSRTSNRTIPGIQSAAWLPSGASAFVRYLSGADFSTINTYSLSANGAGGFFLPQNIADISVSSTSILALASGVNGSAVSSSRPDGTHSTVVFTTPLSSIRVSFAGKTQYLVFTKPSYSLDGYAFITDASGHLSRVAGPLAGLTALASPSGKFVLVSSVSGGVLQTRIITVATGASTNLPVATIADKCVWAANDSVVYCGIPLGAPASFNYPDDWYQGTMQFSDRIWKIDAVSRYAQLVLDFTANTKTSLDAEALALDPLTTDLVFVNKNDGSLWSYSL